MSINAEDLVSSLLFIGYDKVDSALFINAKITADNKFKFEDYSISKFFNSCIDFDGIFFKLKEGLSLKNQKENNCPLNMILNRNNELTNYLISKGFGITENQVQALDKPKTKTLVMKSSS